MEPPSEQIQSDLESFREKWRAEVSARTRNTGGSSRQQIPAQAASSTAAATAATSSSSNPVPRKLDSSHRGPARQVEDDEDYVRTPTFDDDPGNAKAAQSQGSAGDPDGKEPETALEYYEKAVDKETSGKLGDSLHLYRKAYRLDSRVDRAYREKHFPGMWKKKPAGASSTQAAQVAQTNPSDAAVTGLAAAHQPQDQPAAPLSLSDLIASFAGLNIEGAAAEVEGTPPPPCPIADLPEEILIHILCDVAVMDVGDFVRLSQVCKRFAYLVASENRIWRRVCQGSEFGFGAMVYHWQRGISWEDLGLEDEPDEDVFTMEELQQRRVEESDATTNALFSTVYPSWQRMFRQRPRIRFNGCYISTVNYIRTGHASGNHITWNSPVHIVTYYRYLRFFRDGTAISLLTTNEPTDVVHHLTKAMVHQHAKNTASHLPSAVMSQAQKGRWRLSSSIDNPDVSPSDAEGDLFVETEGCTPKYTYRMELSLKNAGKSRNNKLLWKGYWSYNKLADDWAEFGLKNDKAFYFSRVKSYGFGGE
jgi:F-box protein 9